MKLQQAMMGGGWGGWWLLCGALQAQAAAVAASDLGFERTVASQLLLSNNEATSLGAHIATLRNTSRTALQIEPRGVEDWPKQGNGIDASLGPLRLEPGASFDIHYTIGLNDSRQHNPFLMSKVFRVEVSPAATPGTRSMVSLALSARVDAAQVLRLSAPELGEAGSYRCAVAELDHTPAQLRPLHCHNVLPDAQAGAYPLGVHAELSADAADPGRFSHLRPLRLDQLYRTRYVDGSTEPLSCRYPCAVDCSRGAQDVAITPTKARLGYTLEPLVPGLPPISRRMFGDEADLVLEVERRPDLMDPLTRVDTVHAACIGSDCGADAIVIDSIELIDDVGRGFAAPPREEIRRYAPDGELSSGMTLAPAGPRDKAEVAWRITDASRGSYVESHYVIRYHGRDGRPRRFVSPGFGGILEPASDVAAAAAARPAVAPPWWAREQLAGPFLRLDLPDSSMTPRRVQWGTPPPSSQARLFGVLMTSDDGRIGSGTLVGLPQLRADHSIESFKVLTVLHLLVPLFHNGLRPEEYLELYDAPIEVVLSEAWFDDTIDTPDPTAARLPQPEILGRRFHSMRNASIEVSAPWLPALPDVRLPDVMLYTVHPTEHLEVKSSALVGLPVLQFPVLPESRALNLPTSRFGYPQGATYHVLPAGSGPIRLHPMVEATFPALPSKVPSRSSQWLPFNSHTQWLGNTEQFRFAMLNPITGEELVTGSDDWILKGLSGAAVLGELAWEDGVLKRAVVRGVFSSGSRVPETDQLRMHHVGLDVDTSDERGQDFYAWLISHLP